jgi:hypothetical protein
MRKNRTVFLLCGTAGLLGGASTVPSTAIAQAAPPAAEQTFWNLEHTYWHDVETNDLPAYLGLWRKDLLAWPSFNGAPVRKDHITDWITSQTSKGLTAKTIEFKPGEVQVAGNIAMVDYWMTYKWADRAGDGAPHTLRITHTWIWDGKDWHLLGGMSMPEPVTPPK